MRKLIALAAFLVPATALADQTPLVTKGPVITGVTQTDAWVAWETAHHEGSGTECSLDALTGTPNDQTPTLTLSPASLTSDTFTDSTCSRDHLVHITGLSPGTKYSFSLDMPWDSGDPSVGTFITAPPTTDGTFSFVVYGDTRDSVELAQPSTEADHQSVVNAIMSNEMDSSFLLNTGDLALNISLASGDDKGYTEFFDVERAILSSRGVFTVIGNHETMDTSEFDMLVNAPSFAGAPHPYYWSTDWGQVHITFLDAFEGAAQLTEAGAHAPAITDDQAAWVASDLAQAQAAGQLIFIVSHQGPFSHSNDSSAHGGSPDFQSKIIPLMLQYGVLGVFAGHDHYYQRGHEGCIDYFVVGGGGASQYDPDPMASGVAVTEKALSYMVVNVNGHQASAVAKRADGSVLDMFNFSGPNCMSGGTPDAGTGGQGDDGGTLSTVGGDDAGTTSSSDDAGTAAPDAGTMTSHDAGVNSHIDAGRSASSADAGDELSGSNGGDTIKPGCGCGGGEAASAVLLLGLFALARMRRLHR